MPAGVSGSSQQYVKRGRIHPLVLMVALSGAGAVPAKSLKAIR